MAVSAYVTQVSLLLNDPSNTLYPQSSIVTWVNMARQQLATETECVRVPAILYTQPNQQMYALSSASLSTSGVKSIFTVRLANVVNGQAQSYMQTRPWEWFNSYYVGTGSVQMTGVPSLWAQQGRGTLGTIGLYPIPNTQYQINMDVAGLPFPLNTDSDPEAIPYPWTDAVPYYAAYIAYLSVNRNSDAQTMFSMYQMFARRASQDSSPTVLPDNMPGGQGPKTAAEKTTLTTMQQQGR